MTTPFDKQMQRVLEPFDRDHDRLKAELMASLPETPAFAELPQQRSLRRLWTGISVMNRRLIQMGTAVAAVIVLTVMLFGSRGNGSGIVLAEVVNRLKAAHTVTCKMLIYKEGQLTESGDLMYLGIGHQRATLSNGVVFILDSGAGKLIALDPAQKTVRRVETLPSTFDFYQLITSFNAGNELSLGTRQIDNRAVIGYARGANSNISIWLDAKTGALVQMEMHNHDAHGNATVEIAKDFVLDTPLDESLFSVETPPGYTEGPVHSVTLDRVAQLHNAMKASKVAREIALACLKFTQSHQGEWPPALEALKELGITDEKLKDPMNPASPVGWVYVRPAGSRGQLRSPKDTILVHEAFKTWGEGIVVGFADGHAELIKSQDRFNQLLVP